MGTCRFTAAAGGAVSVAPPGEKAPDNQKRVPPKLQYYTDKNTTFTCITLQKKKKNKFDPFSIINPSTVPSSPPFPAALQVDQLMCHKLFESLQVLSIELHVIVPGALHPQRLHGPLAALVQRQAVREVDDLVLRAVDHQHWRRYLRDLVDALAWDKKKRQLE